MLNDHLQVFFVGRELCLDPEAGLDQKKGADQVDDDHQ